MNRLLALLAVAAVLLAQGCSSTRHDRLKARSREINRTLIAQRDDALGLADPAAARARLDHLGTMQRSLTVVDLGLAIVPRLDDQTRPLAYDTIEEALDTIEWNIPLGPGEPARPLPDAFLSGSFAPPAPPRP